MLFRDIVHLPKQNTVEKNDKRNMITGRAKLSFYKKNANAEDKESLFS